VYVCALDTKLFKFPPCVCGGGGATGRLRWEEQSYQEVSEGRRACVC